FISYDAYIEVNAIDTDSSFTVNYVGTDTSSVIIIPENELMRQKGKTVTLQATIYRQIPLFQKTSEDGYIKICHTIKPVTIKLKD
ncbi:MAG: hypothetical protein ABUT20_55700, partial [Bacteroidota bacterium]